MREIEMRMKKQTYRILVQVRTITASVVELEGEIH